VGEVATRNAWSPGTRRNRMPAAARRHQLAEVAAEQFHRVGFHRVTIADVAMAADVSPPAIYRHFSNKQALLYAAIETGVARVEQVLADSPAASWSERIEALVMVAAERRDLWVLLQREMRHLDPAERSQLEHRFAAFVVQMRSELRTVRPDLDDADARLLITAILAAMSSQAVYSARFPGVERRRIIASAVDALSAARLPAHRTKAARPNQGGGPDEPAPPSRREELLRAALALFHERGFEGVSLDDIGAAVGISGPSVLHHFPAKADLLVEIYVRAGDQLTDRRNRGTPLTLEDLVRSYVDFAVTERILFGVYVLDFASLPAPAAREIRSVIDADADAWEVALHTERPELSDVERTILVQAARAIVHDVVRIGHLHQRPHVAADLTILVETVLMAELTTLAGPTGP